MSQLVSILIPAYNVEEWIGDTIRSALAQTWTRKEIIVVDDGSSDGTLQIAQQFESPTVKIETQENMGSCAARNRALRLAQGDYIQWLDADDLLAPDKISRQLEGADDGSKSQIFFTSAFGTFFYRLQKAEFKPNSLWQELEPVDWILAKFMDNVWMNPTTWLVSRKLTELAGSWDERLAGPDDDGEYSCRIVRSSERVTFVPKAMCYYRTGNFGSLSWSSSNEALAGLLLSFRLSIGHLLALEDSERTRTASVKYLQNRIMHFYPEQVQLLQQANDLAERLGGSLSPPRMKWKYSPIERLVGSKAAKRASIILPRIKTMVRKNWDHFRFYWPALRRKGNASFPDDLKMQNRIW